VLNSGHCDSDRQLARKGFRYSLSTSAGQTRYDGTEDIEGNFEWIKGHPKKNWRLGRSPRSPATRTFRCGLGKGRLPAGRLNVVFVARREPSDTVGVVGVYLSARAVFEDGVQWPSSTERTSSLRRGDRS